jgi:hypothetical protein
VSRPVRIQLLAVGREIPRYAQASSSVSEYASIVDLVQSILNIAQAAITNAIAMRIWGRVFTV